MKYSQVEYAFLSEGLGTLAKIINGISCHSGKRIHPTQKPIQLYSWLLSRYAKPGDKILDTHVGSASSLIACERFGFQYVGFEIDVEYYGLAKERIEEERKQIFWKL